MSLSGKIETQSKDFQNSSKNHFQGTDLQIRNLALGASDLALWITGEYKVVYTFFDDQDNRIFRVSGLGEIKRT